MISGLSVHMHDFKYPETPITMILMLSLIRLRRVTFKHFSKFKGQDTGPHRFKG